MSDKEQKQSGAVWVKASDRLPDEVDKIYILRWAGSKKPFVSELGISGGIKYFHEVANMYLHNIEWLNESGQSQTADEETFKMWAVIESYFKDILGDKPFRERVELRKELKERFILIDKLAQQNNTWQFGWQNEGEIPETRVLGK